MNSFFVQPDIPDKAQQILCDQLRFITQKSRIEAEVWQTKDIGHSLQTALGQSSPTLIAVGSRAWLDRIITMTHKVRHDPPPVFGFIPFSAGRTHLLTPYLIRREITTALHAIAARKVSQIVVLQLGESLFTEKCTLGITQSSETFLAKLSLRLNHGDIALSAQATRIDFSLLENAQDDTPLIRLGIRSALLAQSSSTAPSTEFLPDKRTTLRTSKYEDTLHIPIETGTLRTTVPLVCLSHSSYRPEGLITFQPSAQRLKFITSKNQPLRY